MPDLRNDIIGQVARLPLKPSEENALLPLYEAVSNSLHAINDLFGDEKISANGRINIHILRENAEKEINPVIGFRIQDNGIGLDDNNFKSFYTPFSQHKLKKGGKGIGRLGWLKVFRNIHVDSRYNGSDKIEHRAFDFILREKDQIHFTEVTTNSNDKAGTTVTLTNFFDEYYTKCPLKTEIIIQRIIGHFLPIFAGHKSPSIHVHDDKIYDLQKYFDEKIVKSEEKIIEIDIEGTMHPIIVRHMRCDKSIRPRGGQNNWMCFCANDRGVKEFGIDEQIGLKLLNGQEIYVGTVTGDYLDTHVNTQRTDFIFDSEDSKAIRRQVATSVKEFLAEFVEESLAQKKSITTEIIRKNPQYLYLRSELDGFVTGLKSNSNDEESIYIEMSQDRFRRQRKFNVVKSDIVNAQMYTEAIAEKVEDYKQYIQDDQKGTLAEYVTKRKAVLDLLDKLRGFSSIEDKTQHLEEAVHKLICPMRVDSDGISIDEHNLWILDDRLAFYRFFASDVPIKNYIGNNSAREPDIAFFYDSCIAWRESERTCDTVILVEFKRPGLDHYTDKTDPFMQLMDYVSLFKSGKEVRDKKGNVISGIGGNTAFECYIIADITEALKVRLRGRFDSTPDGRGLFGYTRNPDTYTEVIPYSKLLIDAQERNSIFFDKLGLNG